MQFLICLLVPEMGCQCSYCLKSSIWMPVLGYKVKGVNGTEGWRIGGEVLISCGLFKLLYNIF